jgi:drug/metabolite transporter (DMT)-like permease
MKNKSLLGNFLLILTAIIWGTAFVSQRVGMESIEPITFNAARYALGMVAVTLVAWIGTAKKRKTPDLRTPKEQRQRKRCTAWGGIGCGIFLAVGGFFQQAGLVYSTAGKAGFVTAQYMLLVPIANFLLFKKKNTLQVWLAVLIGVVGMYLLCVTEDFGLAYSDLLLLACAFMFCGHIICCDHFVEHADPVWMSAIQFAVATAMSAVAAFVAEEPSMDKLISAAIPILYCGLISGGIGYTLQIVAQKMTDPAIASLLMSLESVFAVLAGALLLHERMSARELAGCAVMFAAIVLVQIPMPTRKKQRTKKL